MKTPAIGFVLVLLLGFAAAPLTARAQFLCITAPRANLRAGPGKEFRVTWQVNRYMPLVQIDKKGRWLKVKDVDGDLHWVFETLVSPKVDCITIKSPTANIRKKPSAKAGKWFTVKKYTSFRRVGARRRWVKITYEGEAMWVYGTLVWPTRS